MEEEEKNYHSDRPITDSNHDNFNRAAFADDVVEMFSSLGKDESFVVGLYAKWGFGKTSTINMIEEKLDREKFIPVRINAWMLGGSPEKILWQILDDTSRAVNNKSAKNRVSKIGEGIGIILYGKLPFEIDKEIELGGGWGKKKITSGKIIDTIGFVGRLMESSNTISKARQKVEEGIKNSGKKVIVFIDDIDRLNSEQIVEVFRLLNGIADYAGISYILPFDKDFVCSAIEEHIPDGQKGADYIEKIVQIPLNLPALQRHVVDNVFLSALEQILDESSITIGDKKETERFRSLYHSEGIREHIQSPRDINKIYNTLKFTLPVADGEVNIVDMVVLEIIRVFDEPFYEKIKNNKDVLVKYASHFSDYAFDDKNEKRKTDAEKLFGQKGDRELAIVMELFPVINDIFNNFSYSDPAELRKLQRIASEYYFDIFFTSFDESIGISDRKILHLLNNATDKETISKNLEIINQQNCDIALITIRDRSDLIKNKVAFCEGLLDLAETLQKHEQIRLMLSAFESVLFTIDEILKDSTNKLSDYKSLLEYSFKKDRIDAVYYLISRVMARSDREDSYDRAILDKDDLQQYKEFAFKIVRKIAKNNKMPINTTESYAPIFRYWVDLGGSKNEVDKHIRKHVKSADAAIDFLTQFLSTSSSLGGDDRRRGDLNNKNYEWMCGFLDPEYFYRLITKDVRYKSSKGIAKENLVSFEDRWNEDSRAISAVGNEHTAAFRMVVARRFIYMFENTPREAEIVSEENKDSDV